MHKTDITRQLKTTLLLLVLTAAAAVYILLVEWRAESPPPGAGRPIPALGAALEKIDYISLRHENLTAELERSQGQWNITAPIQARADTACINYLLTGAENLPRLETITENQRNARGVTLADCGLAAPRARIVFGSGGRRTSAIDVGNLSPLRDSLYVRFDQQSDIVATTTNLLNVLPRTLDELRSRRLVAGDHTAIERMEIKSAQGPLIKLGREGGEWIIQRPITARANREKVMQCLEQIYNLSIAKFVSETMADPVAYGLGEDEAGLQISLWSANADAGLKINFGNPVAGEPLLYVTLNDATSVYAVPRAAVQALPTQLSVLRDTRLYFMAPEKTSFIGIESDSRLLHLQLTDKTWQIIAPIQIKADNQAVSDLLHRLNTLRIESFVEPGETNQMAPIKPDLVIRLAETPPPTGVLTQTLADASAPAPEHVGGRVLRIGVSQTEPVEYFARFDDDQQLFRLSTAAVSAISADAADYRDRTVLALDPQSVRAITCAAKGVCRTMEYIEPKGWQAVDAGEPLTNQPSAALIPRLLSLTANLRATRFERGTPTDLARYGLAEPLFSINFTLTGTEGVRKSLLGGQPAEDRGIFGMIQGQPGVFVIDREIADICAELLAQ
ncbi:MAG: DUF4340 domain-containing protein [Kiritimatiellia bacterium]